MKKVINDKKTDKKSLPNVKNEINFEPETNDLDDNDLEESILHWIVEGDYSDFDEPDIKPIIDEIKEDITHTQRLKKRMTMKRHKSKLKIARRRASKRRANLGTIKKRARRQAISNIKKIITKGKNLKKSSASEKNRVERMVKRREPLVKRGARKLIRTKRSDERRRLQKNSVEMTGNTLNEVFDVFYNTLKKDS